MISISPFHTELDERGRKSAGTGAAAGGGEERKEGELQARQIDGNKLTISDAPFSILEYPHVMTNMFTSSRFCGAVPSKGPSKRSPHPSNTHPLSCSRYRYCSRKRTWDSRCRCHREYWLDTKWKYKWKSSSRKKKKKKKADERVDWTMHKNVCEEERGKKTIFITQLSSSLSLFSFLCFYFVVTFFHSFFHFTWGK